VRAAIAATPADAIISVPARDRPPLRRWGEGPVTLLGDAAHPMLPSLAQGAAMAVEDAVVLARHLAGPADPVTALRGYEADRRGRATQITKRARALSRIEQLEHPIATSLRNAYIRWMPGAVVDRRNRADLTYPSYPSDLDGVRHAR
jgi:2-polyprenyl-6-methoxyphenol hydroxylase-like FAD-dependent oxidoreductase